MNPSSKSGGFILVLSLFFLLLTTVIGLFLFRSSTLELRMAGNAGAKAVSFENAEAARISAESTITALADNISAGTAYDCTKQGIGYYASAGTGSNCALLDHHNLKWDTSDTVVDGNNKHSRFAFEYLGLDDVYEIGDDVEMGAGNANTFEVHVFRVVSLGDEATGAESTIETVFLARKS